MKRIDAIKRGETRSQIDTVYQEIFAALNFCEFHDFCIFAKLNFANCEIIAMPHLLYCTHGSFTKIFFANFYFVKT